MAGYKGDVGLPLCGVALGKVKEKCMMNLSYADKNKVLKYGKEKRRGGNNNITMRNL